MAWKMYYIRGMPGKERCKSMDTKYIWEIIITKDWRLNYIHAHKYTTPQKTGQGTEVYDGAQAHFIKSYWSN